MKKIELIAAIAAAVFALSAPKASAQLKLEFGGGVSMMGLAESKSVSDENLVDMSHNISPVLYGELKKVNNKFDYGANLSLTYGSGKAKYRGVEEVAEGQKYLDWQQMKFNSLSTALLAFADYNFGSGSNVSPFIGAGAGAAYGHRWNDINNNEPNEMNVLVMVRAGLGFSNGLNLSATYRKYLKNSPFYSNIGITVGWSFGI